MRRAVAHPSILTLEMRAHASFARPVARPPEARLGTFLKSRTNNPTRRRRRRRRPSRALRAQTLLDRNKALIHEINKNHEARAAGGMERNVDLLRELNSNVAKAQELYEEAGGGFEFRDAEEGRSDEAERRA